MATIVLTNLSADEVFIRDLYLTLGAAGSVDSTLGRLEEATLTRPASEVAKWSHVQELVAAGTISCTVTLSDDEKNSGLAQPPNSVGALDMAEVASTDLASGLVLIRKALTSGGAAGTEDDVTVYAVDALPFKMRVLDAWAFVSTAAAGTDLTIGDEAATAGTTAGTVSANATGRAGFVPASNASTVLTPAADKGLFIRRDRSVVGEIFILVRRES